MRQSSRTFVGLADDQTLEDFEATALQARRLLRSLETQLCRLEPRPDLDGALRTALDAGGVEITSVQFIRADLMHANVAIHSDVQKVWLVRMQRTGPRWHVAAVAAQP